MIVEVNLKTLVDKKLTPGQYILLSFLNAKQIAEADALVVRQIILPKEILELGELGYILNASMCFGRMAEVLVSKTKMNEVFGEADPESLFWEFFSTYPVKVSGRSGMRMLRPTSQDAKGTKICKKKYESYLGTKGVQAKHDHVMKCLEAELSVRRRDNSMQYMQGLEVYLNQQSWSLYEELLTLQNTVKNEVSYGEKLI